jgi:hypothetical protein
MPKAPKAQLGMRADSRNAAIPLGMPLVNADRRGMAAIWFALARAARLGIHG